MSGWCVLAAGALYLGEAVVCAVNGKTPEFGMLLFYAGANVCYYFILAR